MNPESHSHDYPNEPRLRDMPRTIGNWPRIAILALDPALSNDYLTRLAGKYLSILSILFSLWISGSL